LDQSAARQAISNREEAVFKTLQENVEESWKERENLVIKMPDGVEA
jgi:hypothetical protein